MPTVSHLGHVHLKVRDLERAVDFYAGLLDLEETERFGDYAFLTFGDHHHDLALQAVSSGDSPRRGDVGLYHSAWEVDSREALRACYEWLLERGVDVAAVDHGISLALYFDDPAGNGVEVYLDTRAERDRDEWRGLNERFDPTAL